ncbi:MAG: hypothetical protein ACK5MJ_08305 [Alphaproteobacteria bacterium]
MLKQKLLLTTFTLSLAYTASAATVAELENQLKQMQQQTEALEQQLEALKTQPQTDTQPSTTSTQSVQTQQLQQPQQPQDTQSQSDTQIPTGVKVDGNNHLLGEGKGTAPINSLSVKIADNPNRKSEAAATQQPQTNAQPQVAQIQQLQQPQNNAPTQVAQTKQLQQQQNNAPTQLEKSVELQNAIAKVQAGSFGDAQKDLTAYVADESRADVNVAYYWLGEALFRQSQYEPAAMAFTKSYKQNSNSSIAPDALIRLSLSLGLLNRTEEACKLLLYAETRFPNEKEKIAIAADERRRLNCQ